MSRKEDFIQAGIDYRFEQGKPMAIGGDNFAEMAKEMNRTKPFENGAEYGYQYAKKSFFDALTHYCNRHGIHPNTRVELISYLQKSMED